MLGGELRARLLHLEVGEAKPALDAVERACPLDRRGSPVVVDATGYAVTLSPPDKIDGGVTVAP